MKISGFTFIRNANRFDYPIREAILSILPVCDEVVVMVGKSDDGTRELIESIGDPRIKIFDSVWDDTLREGGRVLAEETNKAFDHISPDTDWAFYIQGDEVFHEHGVEAIQDAMKTYLNDPRVEGLLFNYHHFYGSYDYIGDSRRWYRKEIRIIRNDKSIRSWRDAQGFRKNGKKLNVKPVYAFMHHYGWVKPPKVMQEKQLNFNKLWHSDDWVKEHIPNVSEFDYSGIDSLLRFRGTHPAVIRDRIAACNWKFAFDPTKRNRSLKQLFLKVIEDITGWRIGEYRNYRLVK